MLAVHRGPQIMKNSQSDNQMEVVESELPKTPTSKYTPGKQL